MPAWRVHDQVELAAHEKSVVNLIRCSALRGIALVTQIGVITFSAIIGSKFLGGRCSQVLED